MEIDHSFLKLSKKVILNSLIGNVKLKPDSKALPNNSSLDLSKSERSVPFQKSVNSVDAQSAVNVKTKQIMFYSDLVACNDLEKMFSVLDKTPSITTTAIYKQRIK